MVNEAFELIEYSHTVFLARVSDMDDRNNGALSRSDISFLLNWIGIDMSLLL